MIRFGYVVRSGGVPKAIREKIFEPFFTTKKVGEGTGIGLSTSLEIARSAGGSIDVENVADGARFTLHIPVKPGMHGASDAPAASAGDERSGLGQIAHVVPASTDR